MLKRGLLTLFVLLMSASLVHALDSTREFEGVHMPETLQIGEKTVALNGVGERKVMFMQPYVAGLYLRDAETDPSAVMRGDELMALRLELTRNTGRRMMLRALRNGMRSATDTLGDVEWGDVEARYEVFTEMLPGDFAEGSIIEFKYIPGDGMQVYRDGDNKGTVPGLDFKQAFFGIWLNEDSPADEDLKTAMMAGDMRVAMADIRAEEERRLAAAEAEKRAAEEARLAEKKAAEEARLAEKKAREEARLAEKKAKEEARRLAAREAEEADVDVDTISEAAFVDAAIYFGFDSSDLSDNAKRKLDEKVEWMKANPGVSVTLEAMTDEMGPAVYNKWLAEQRGRSVKTYLENAGIPSGRIDLEVIGEVPGGVNTENRRVQFKIQ